MADSAGGGGQGFLAVRHYTEQRGLAKFWQDADVCFSASHGDADGVVEDEAGNFQSMPTGLADGQQSVIDCAEAEAGDD